MVKDAILKRSSERFSDRLSIDSLTSNRRQNTHKGLYSVSAFAAFYLGK